MLLPFIALNESDNEAKLRIYPLMTCDISIQPLTPGEIRCTSSRTWRTQSQAYLYRPQRHSHWLFFAGEFVEKPNWVNVHYHEENVRGELTLTMSINLDTTKCLSLRRVKQDLP